MVPAVATNSSSVGGSLGGLLNRVSIGGSSGGASWDAFRHRRGSDGPAPAAAPAPQPPVNGIASGVTSPASAESTTGAAPHRSNGESAAMAQDSASVASGSAPANPGRAFPPPLEPRSYTILKEVGDGSFGTVWLADWHSPLQLPPGTLPPGPSSRPEYKGKKLVAVKRMKKPFEGGWAECLQLKELKSLQQIPMHNNIIPLYDAFLLPSTKELYFVFECMEGNLFQLTKSRKGRPLASGLIASIFYQILAGLEHIHSAGYFHRDMKPENLLITTTGLADYPASSLYALPGTPPEKDVVVTVKLADFGLARETKSRPPYTEYVSTRWYRAPEVLLRSREYSNPVDMWALGTIMVEILTLKPLFPGENEVEQVFKICEVLGDPCTDYGIDSRGRIRGGGDWPKGIKMARAVGFAFPKIPPKTFQTMFDQNTVPIQLIDCIADCLRYNPRDRLTPKECLDSSYFREVAYRYAPYRPASLRTTPSNSSSASPNGTHRNSSSLSISTAASSHVPPMPSPREVPPSHSNRDSAHVQPPFRPSLPGQQLPPANGFPYPDSAAASPANIARHDSDTSMVSGMSGYAMHVNPPPGEDGSYDSPMASFPESVSEQTSPTPSSVWNGQVDPSWGAQPRAPLVFGAPVGGGRRGSFSGSIAPSLAPSTFYDGSVYEGVPSNRAPSVMSFPFGNLDSGSPTFDESPTMGANGGFDPQASSSQQQQQLPPASLAPPAPSVKSGRWGGFGKAFSSNNSHPPVASTSTSPMLQQASQNPLKRTPSNASQREQQPADVEMPRAPLDPKKAKKEAKEAEKARRDALQQAQRERARAVMKKKNQLAEAADPLNNFSNQTRAAPLDKGKHRAADQRSLAPSSASIVNAQMPRIVEDTSRLHVSDMRHKARRRDVDDDVHSVSSNETGHSSQRGRPFSVSGISISSVATSASDPERRSQHTYDVTPQRVPSLSSITSSSSRPYHHQSGFRHHVPPPSTGHSSLDHSLIANMQGLATSNDGLRSPSARSERSDSRGARASSPRDSHSHHEQQRYSPYLFPNGTSSSSTRSPGPQLPPITNFDPSQYRTKSSAASVASFRSTPSTLPSYLGRPSMENPAAAIGGQAAGAPPPGRQYALNDSVGGLSGGSTFPSPPPPPNS